MPSVTALLPGGPSCASEALSQKIGDWMCALWVSMNLMLRCVVCVRGRGWTPDRLG